VLASPAPPPKPIREQIDTYSFVEYVPIQSSVAPQPYLEPRATNRPNNLGIALGAETESGPNNLDSASIQGGDDYTEIDDILIGGDNVNIGRESLILRRTSS
jgi:hypothetical protein